MFVLNIKIVRKYLSFDPKCIEMRSFGKKKEIAYFGMTVTLFDFHFEALSPKLLVSSGIHNPCPCVFWPVGHNFRDIELTFCIFFITSILLFKFILQTIISKFYDLLEGGKFGYKAKAKFQHNIFKITPANVCQEIDTCSCICICSCVLYTEHSRVATKGHGVYQDGSPQQTKLQISRRYHEMVSLLSKIAGD